MKKYMKILSGLLIGMILVLVIVTGSGYLWSFRISGVTVPASDMEVPSVAQVGSVVTAKQVVILPLRGNIEEVEVIPGEGWATSGMPRVSWEKYLWNRKKLLVETDLVPLTSGMTGSGEVKLVFRNTGEPSLIWKIPPFNAEISGDSGNILQLADAVEVHKTFEYRYLWIGFGLALAAVVIYWIWKRHSRRNKMPIPPWKRCLNRRIFNHKVTKGFASRGKSTKGWFYGFKLHGVCSEKGLLEAVVFTSGNIHDSKMV